MKSSSLSNLNSFLQLGYFLDFKPKDELFQDFDVDKSRYESSSHHELVHLGSSLILSAIEKNFAYNQKHLVPISGGMDSRAILAALLQFTEAENIYTYTFGTPNTLDYDIGNEIAEHVGTKHNAFNLLKYQYTLNELLDISSRVQKQTVLFHHPPIHIIDSTYPDHIIWSGFMGDPITGSHLPTLPASSLEKAKESFIAKNIYVKSVDLREHTESYFFDLIDYYGIQDISLEETLDFLNRQTKFIAPHVLMKGYQYKLPFLDRDFVNFFLSVPSNFRKNQSLYIDILLNKFPELFSLRTKNNLGLPLRASKNRILRKRISNKAKSLIRHLWASPPNLNINYLDFNRAIREKTDLKLLIITCIKELQHRKLIPWLNLEDLLNAHLNKEKDIADALLVLTSLEIHLKAGKKI
ncbi:asparagine synthase-related protein [Catalinimonas sp. 4WD22]|uniref:asparagine synthase-related protein n=1 Tax=Catalinimonas locisalis TaxID=3133978 RepID=UPI0031013D5F